MPNDLSARDAQAAAEIDADVGVQHIAAVYAEGFLGATESAGRTEAAVAELDDLVENVLDEYPKLEEILGSGLIQHEEKVSILDHVFGGRVSDVLLNFLKVVSRHDRLDCLRAIHRHVYQLYNQRQDRVLVELSTATPVSDQLVQRIAQRLREMLDAEPIMQPITDPELIGGLVVKVGDTVYDGSVSTQLKKMRQQMIDRSANEIQSRRDRFRYPAGN